MNSKKWQVTPRCDNEKRSAGHFSDYLNVLHITDAEDLEIELNLAQAKLEIVLGNLEAGIQMGRSPQEILNHIEREFEWLMLGDVDG